MTRRATAVRPLLGRLLLLAAAAVIGVFVAPEAAQAHPTLLFTTPAADTAEPGSPSTVVLVFNEAVTAAPNGLVVLDPAGRQIPVEAIASGRQGRAVTGRIAEALPVGVYALRWRVTGADGDLVESTFRFAVGAPITGPGTGPVGGTGTSWPGAGLRWLLLAGLAVALGGAIAARWTDQARTVRPSLPALSRWPPVAGAVVGSAAAAGLATWLAADVGARALTASTPGRVLLVEGVALIAAAVLLASNRRRWAWLPLLAVPVAEGVRGHAGQAVPGWGALATAVHVAAAAVWVGALVHVVRAAVVGRVVPAAVWWTVSGYARIAAWLFATVVVTGTISALILVPLPAVTATAYGRLLLVKLALVAAAATAALTARWWLRSGPDTLPRIAGATRVEAAVLAGVLAVTAALTATPPARDSGPPPASPPAGVVLPWASLAGQIGVSVAASDGQLVVRLSTPRRGDYYAPTGDAPTYRLSATLVPPGLPARALRLSGCGVGCFVAPVAWGTGDNLLTLRAAASGWTGGTVSAALPWPVRPAPQRLAAVVAAMHQAGQVSVHEAVTSDTSTPSPEPTALSLTGAQFVAGEPYSAGIAPQVVELRRDRDTVRLAVGFPAEGRYAELLLDSRDRIVEEVLVDAKHLTRCRFTYPDQHYQ